MLKVNKRNRVSNYFVDYIKKQIIANRKERVFVRKIDGVSYRLC